MKNINTIVIVGTFLVICTPKLFSQQSFELVYGTEMAEYFSSTFEDNDGNYISLGARKKIYGQGPSSPIIVKIDNNGSILQDSIFTKQDTNYYFRFGFQKSNGNYFIIGTLSDSSLLFELDVTYFCELTPDFNLVWEKMYVIPQPYIHHQIREVVMDPDGNVLIQGIADTSQYSYNDFMFISRINQQGDMLEFKMYENWADHGAYSEFLPNFDSTGYVIFGICTYGPGFAREWVEFDQDLEITGYVSIIDPEHIAVTPTCAKWLPNGNLITANRASMEPGADQDLYVKIMDQELNTLNDTLLYYDEQVYCPVMSGLDFTDENNIWVGSFVGIPPSFSGSEVFRILIFDSEANLKGMKAYGGEMRYWFFNLFATSDGGCILTGVTPDYEGADNSNGYIIKVMPGDILTDAEETPFEFDMDVAVFPNPFSGSLHFESARKNLWVSLVDNTGKEVLNGELSGLSRTGLATNHLPPGFYYYNITDNGRTIQSGKLIKQ